MCMDPVSAGLTFSKIGTALAAASSAVGAVSAIQQGNAAQKQAQVNAEMQRRAAADTIGSGDKEAERRLRAAAQQRGQQAVGLAANGADVTQGDALGLLDETRGAGIEDALTIRENALRGAQGLQQSAANSITEGNAARSSGRARAAGTILTGAARVGKQWSGWSADKYSQPMGSFA